MSRARPTRNLDLQINNLGDIDHDSFAVGANTAAKRRSIAELDFLIVSPVADGTIDATDRAHEAGFYAGLSY